MKRLFFIIVYTFVTFSSFAEGFGNSFTKEMSSFTIGVGYTYVSKSKLTFNVCTIKTCHNYYTSVSMYAGCSVPLSKTMRISPIIGVNEIYLHGIKNMPINGYYTKFCYGCMFTSTFIKYIKMNINGIMTNNYIGFTLCYKL